MAEIFDTKRRAPKWKKNSPEYQGKQQQHHSDCTHHHSKGRLQITKIIFPKNERKKKY